MKIILVYRATQFSPHSVKKDMHILEAVGHLLDDGHNVVEYRQEEDLVDEERADLFLSMGRLPETLDILQKRQEEGCRVVNTPESVRMVTCRSGLDALMRANGFPMAPLCVPKPGSDDMCDAPDGGGWWLKKGSGPAECLYDVQYAATWDDVVRKLGYFKNRDIEDVNITAHVPGDVVKFYGVAGTDFFRYYYPTDDGQTKFGDEERNGRAHHYGFSPTALHGEAERLAALTGLQVYGGDVIVKDDGSFVIIDFNDWPSFARCREEAAMAIADKVKNLFK